jgi:hypothetical protein
LKAILRARNQFEDRPKPLLAAFDQFDSVVRDRRARPSSGVLERCGRIIGHPPWFP